MKVQIKNNKIIESAHFDYNGKFPKVIINTIYKYIYPDSTTYYLNNPNNDEEYLEFNYYFEDENYIDKDNDYEDSVKLIPETNEEKDILNRAQFVMHEKNQRIILFINWEDIDGRVQDI